MKNMDDIREIIGYSKRKKKITIHSFDNPNDKQSRVIHDEFTFEKWNREVELMIERRIENLIIHRKSEVYK